MAVPGCPLPTFCTASAASRRTVSTARTSSSLHPAFLATGRGRPGSRCASRPFVFADLRDRVGVVAVGAVLDAAVGTNGSPSAALIAYGHEPSPRSVRQDTSPEARYGAGPGAVPTVLVDGSRLATQCSRTPGSERSTSGEDLRDNGGPPRRPLGAARSGR